MQLPFFIPILQNGSNDGVRKELQARGASCKLRAARQSSGIPALNATSRALERLPGFEPALILVNLSSPGPSGLDLVERVRRTRPELDCLVITGHADPLYRAPALAAGAVGYMTKDDPDEILAAVLRCLASGAANSD